MSDFERLDSEHTVSNMPRSLFVCPYVEDVQAVMLFSADKEIGTCALDLVMHPRFDVHVVIQQSMGILLTTTRNHHVCGNTAYTRGAGLQARCIRGRCVMVCCTIY